MKQILEMKSAKRQLKVSCFSDQMNSFELVHNIYTN